MDRSKVDTTIKIRERQIESNVTNKLRNEALRAFSGQTNGKLFYPSQILHLKVTISPGTFTC